MLGRVKSIFQRQTGNQAVQPRQPASLPADKRILFCVGAQKAGTTWLFDMLKRHPECHFGIGGKEFHYFDARQGLSEFGLGRAFRRGRVAQVVQDRARAVEMAQSDGEYARRVRAVQRAVRQLDMFRAEPEGQEAYLNNLIAGSGPARNLCDFTPAYALLEASTFRMMREIGNDAKFVFVMRDPLSRFWSQLRMYAARTARNKEDIPDRSHMFLQRSLDREPPGMWARCDYRHTVETLDASVPAENVLYLFYEDLFRQATFDRLCEFIEIESKAIEARPIHQGVSVDFPKEFQDALLKRLAPQYDFVAERFGSSVPDAWQRP